MRNLRTSDAWLLGVFLSVFAILMVLHVSQLVRGGFAWIPVTVTAVTDPGEAPRLRTFRTPEDAENSPLKVGDEFVRVGDAEVVGLGPARFSARVYEQATGTNAVSVVVRRGDEQVEATLGLLPIHLPWRVTMLATAFVAMGALSLWRSGTHGARMFFLASGFFGLHWLYLFGGPEPTTIAGIVLLGLGPALGVPFAIRWMLSFPEDTARTDLWSRIWPWAFAPIGPAASAWAFGIPFDPVLGQTLAVGLSGATALTIVVLIIQNFRRTGPAGRRQIKWLAFGFEVAMAPILLLSIATLSVPTLWRVYEASLVLEAAIPIGAFIAIGHDHLFDIDRLLTRATSLSVLTFLFLAGPMFAAPRAAEAMAGFVEPTVSQAVVAFGFAALILGIRNGLEPRIERALFRERAALEVRARGVRAELGECEKAEELFALLGQRLNELLEPTSLAIYIDSPDGFAPAVARGPAIAPLFEADGLLVSALRLEPGPVRSEALRGSLDEHGFDRAALAAMATELILPILNREDLLAFVCLGSKASGDRYTGADLALLASIADKTSDVVQSYGRAQMLRQQQVMVERLQRFVPGAIVERVQEGSGFAPGEREVTVLFADIRGYTSFSESRRPEQIFEAIDRYTRTVSEIVEQHGGAIIDFNGDGVMAAFGAHAPLADKESAAVRAASAISATVTTLTVESPDGSGPQRLGVGVGIATGEAYVGTIHSSERAIWCVLGNATNLAARLEGLTRTLDAQVVIDSVTHERSDAVAGFIAQGPTEVKGRSTPIEIHALPMAQ